MSLVDSISRRTPAAPANVRTGVVRAIAADGTCTVELAGALLDRTPRLASYSAPAIGHVVLLLQYGAQLIILGTVATA